MMRLLSTNKSDGYFGGGHAALCDESHSDYSPEEKLLPFPSSDELGYGDVEGLDDSHPSDDEPKEEPVPEEPAEPDWQEENQNKLQNILRSRRSSMEHVPASTKTSTTSSNPSSPESQPKIERKPSREVGGHRERAMGTHVSRSRSGEGLQPRRERSTRNLMTRERSARRLTGSHATGTAPRPRPTHNLARRSKSMDTSSTWGDDDSLNESSEVEPRLGRRSSALATTKSATHQHHHHHHPRMPHRPPERAASRDDAAKDRRRQMMKRRNSFKRAGSLKNLTDLADDAPPKVTAGDEISIDDTVQIDDDDEDRKSKGRRPVNRREMLRKSKSERPKSAPRRRAESSAKDSSSSSKYESNSFSKVQRMKELGEKALNARHQLQQEEDQELSLEELQQQPPKEPTFNASRIRAGIGSLANLQISRGDGGSFNGSWNVAANASAGSLNNNEAKSSSKSSRERRIK